MKLLLLFVLLLGWMGCIYQATEHRRRREIVRNWAEKAYEIGHGDGCWGVSEDVSESNKQFSVDAVINAYDGAW